MRNPPKVLKSRVVATSRLFSIEELQLCFSNGVKRTYERLLCNRTKKNGSVIIVAMLDHKNAIVIEEYCVGLDKYLLSLPKGIIDPGENPFSAANRELQEETGFGSKKLEYIKDLSLSPGSMNQTIKIFLARDLYENKLIGDEPEPIRIDTINIFELSQLLNKNLFNEGRAIAALYLVRDFIIKNG